MILVSTENIFKINFNISLTRNYQSSSGEIPSINLGGVSIHPLGFCHYSKLEKIVRDAVLVSSLTSNCQCQSGVCYLA